MTDADDVQSQLERGTPGRAIVWPPEGAPQQIKALSGVGSLRIALDRLLPSTSGAPLDLGLIFDEGPSPFRGPARRNEVDRSIVMTFADGSKLGLGLPPERPAHDRTEVRIAWAPSTSGPLLDRDVAEASRLAEHLGRWIELLADDDPRLPEAEATRNALDAELRLSVPRRGMLRAVVQAALDMLRAEVDELTASVGELLGEPRDAGRSIALEAPPVELSISEPDPAAEEQWQAVSDHVSRLADAAAKALPEEELPAGPPTADEDEPAAPGRGTVLLEWVGKESAAGIVRAGAVIGAGAAITGVTWLGANGPGAVGRVIESLLNLVGI